MTTLSFVTWKWPSPKGYRSTFGPAQVNTLARMVARQYTEPHRFICVTDEPEGIDPAVEVLPAWNDFADLPSPSGGHNPSCYRRLRMFARDIGQSFGPRFVSMDLDVVITGDLRPLVNRDEEFVIWGDTNPSTFYNGSLILMSAGARPHVWERFDPVASPKAAKAAGHHGSDQGWISHCLGPKETKWGKADGVYSYRNDIERNGDRLPSGARIVVCHGPRDPWGSHLQRLPWVKEHYR